MHFLFVEVAGIILTELLHFLVGKKSTEASIIIVLFYSQLFQSPSVTSPLVLSPRKKTTKIVFNLTSATWIDLLVWPRKVIAYLPFP